MALSNIEHNVELLTGLSISEVRALSPEEFRTHIECKAKRKLTFVSEFPVIGRGNILRNGLADSAEINKDIDKILGIR